jgi:hypothetical protein
MFNGFLKAISLSALVAGVVVANADITFHSGNGGGSQDSIITAVAGSQSGSFATLTSTDFANAKNGSKAFILAGLAGGWISDLGDGSGAKWIGVDDYGWNNSFTSHSALYAMNFDWANSTPDATLNLRFSVDDQFGDANNEGLFLDGVAIANSKSATDWNNQVENKTYDLGSLTAGQHTLYFDVYNSGSGPSGAIFSGSIQAQAVPEPASMAALGVGIVGIARRRRARRA